MININNTKLLDYLVQYHIPKRYLKETKYIEYSIKFEKLLNDLESNGLFIYGGVGVGKSQLVVDLLGELAEKKKIEVVVDTKWEENSEGRMSQVNVYNPEFNPELFRYYSVPELLIEIRGTFDTKESLEEFLGRFDRYEYLILDDLGVEKISEWVLEILYIIINRRYNNMQKVIITSNKSIKEISQALGDRIASRLTEMCQIIKLEGVDKRLDKV